MNGIIPLILLWLASRAKNGSGTPPAWPTAASPPPPMPAFAPQTSVHAATADSGTPLAALHARPPRPTPPSRSKASPTAARHSAAKALKRAAGRHHGRVVSIP